MEQEEILNADEICKKTILKINQFIKNNDYISAEILIDQYLRVRPDWKSKQIASIIKLHLKKFEEARQLCLTNIKEMGLAEDYSNLSLIERCLNSPKLSHKYAKIAYEKSPNSHAIISNYSIASKILGKNKKSLTLIEKAISLDPENWMYLSNKASMLTESIKINKAKETFEIALKKNPIDANLNIDYFYCLMNIKKYKNSWHHYEHRYRIIDQLKSLIETLDRPLLQIKKPHYSEKIAIIPEQGMGDNLMYLRFIKDFQKIAPNSYYYCPENLLKFVENTDIKVDINFKKDSEQVIGIMSLPYHLGIQKIPKFNSPIRHQPEKTEKLKVGICWAGSPMHPMDKTRSTYFESFLPFLIDKDMQIFSFQKDRRPRKYANNNEVYDYSLNFEKYPNIIDMAKNLNNAYETAVSMNKIDLFISVDTFPVHISGSIGVPTYVITSELPDWRWGKKRKKTDWYDSVQIIRKHSNRSYAKIIATLYKKVRNEHVVRSLL